jgi:hypothetical protein
VVSANIATQKTDRKAFITTFKNLSSPSTLNGISITVTVSPPPKKGRKIATKTAKGIITKDLLKRKKGETLEINATNSRIRKKAENRITFRFPPTTKKIKKKAHEILILGSMREITVVLVLILLS